LGLAEAVTLTGHISQQDMITCYRLADLYVSMSEHEGFGKPLIESMYLGLPVLAYAATAVPGTMGEAGVLFHEKNYEALAELVDILVQDTALRQQIIARQRAEVQRFLEPQVKQIFVEMIESLQVVGLPDMERGKSSG
jgi:glycosyltransferase involved in cell wall biosynthesis